VGIGVASLEHTAEGDAIAYARIERGMTFTSSGKRPFAAPAATRPARATERSVRRRR
jgi:hypothetical protein